ncbi:MAG: hypothetical protein AAF404_13555 [Pseudomonadota bacterium]
MKIQQTGIACLKILITIAIIGLLSIPILLLPKGFKGDLTLIGHGSVSVVLPFDKNLAGTTDTMELLNRIRPDFEERVEFLAVDIATPTGLNFVRNQRTGVLELIIFDTEGTRQAVLPAGPGETLLRSSIEQVLAGSAK